MVLGQASADGFTRETVMVGQLDHRASQQLQRPASATFGRARTGGGDEEGFFVAGQLTIGACPRLLVQGGFEITFNEAPLGPVNGRAADSHSSGNIFVAEPAVGREQNLGSFDLAGVMLAAAHQRGEFTPLGFAQFDMVAYVHPGLLANREAQTNQAMNQLFGTCPRWIPTRSATPSTALVPQRKVGFPIPNAGLLLGFQGTKTARRKGISSPFSDPGGCTSPQNSGPAPTFTDKQGQYLAFIYAYSRIFRHPPAEADMQRHFQVSPPSVHQMVLTLERAGLIRRTPGVARSIEILVEPEDLPVLR